MTEEQRDEIRRTMRERAEERRKRMIPPSPTPRYEGLYFAGTTWLDRITRGEEEEGWFLGGGCPDRLSRLVHFATSSPHAANLSSESY